MNDQPLTAAAAWGEPARPNLPEYTVSEGKFTYQPLIARFSRAFSKTVLEVFQPWPPCDTFSSGSSTSMTGDTSDGHRLVGQAKFSSALAVSPARAHAIPFLHEAYCSIREMLSVGIPGVVLGHFRALLSQDGGYGRRITTSLGE
jgi:hypothetical protein